MEQIKNFCMFFVITFLLAFVMFVIIGGLIHLCYSQFTIDYVLAGAIGCGIGCGLVNGFMAAFTL